MEGTESKEVILIASKILEMINENISSSEDVIIAALKVCANVVEETKAANFRAVLMANMLQKGLK